jgi:hypothetical protein
MNADDICDDCEMPFGDCTCDWLSGLHAGRGVWYMSESTYWILLYPNCRFKPRVKGQRRAGRRAVNSK